MGSDARDGSGRKQIQRRCDEQEEAGTVDIALGGGLQQESDVEQESIDDWKRKGNS